MGRARTSITSVGRLVRASSSKADLIFLCVAVVTGTAGVGVAQEPVELGVQWPKVDGRVPPVRRSLLSAPALTLGTSLGPDETLLAGVVGSARLPGTGDIAIADAGASRIIYFNNKGRFLRSVGRAGDGPGEFRILRWFGRCSDSTLAAFDAAHARITQFSPSGALQGSFAVPATFGFDRVLRCQRNRQVVMLLNQYRDRVKLGSYLEAPTALVRIDSSAVDTVTAGGTQQYYVGQRGGYSDLPLGRTVLASAGGSRIHMCTGHDGACQVFSLEGKRLGRFVLSLPQRRVSAHDWSLAIAARIALEPLPETRRIVEGVLREVPKPDQFPLLDAVVTDLQGNLWVRTFDNYKTPAATWLVVQTDGRVVAAVAMPRAVQVLEIGRDYLLGLTRDSEGVERVVLHTFSPLTGDPIQ